MRKKKTRAELIIELRTVCRWTNQRVRELEEADRRRIELTSELEATKVELESKKDEIDYLREGRDIKAVRIEELKYRLGDGGIYWEELDALQRKLRKHKRRLVKEMRGLQEEVVLLLSKPPSSLSLTKPTTVG